MITLFKNNADKNDILTDLKNPFNKQCIDAVNINIYKSMFYPYEVIHTSTIKFKNGNTKGEQKIEANDLKSLLTDIQFFIDNL